MVAGSGSPGIARPLWSLVASISFFNSSRSEDSRDRFKRSPISRDFSGKAVPLDAETSLGEVTANSADKVVVDAVVVVVEVVDGNTF